MFRKKIAIGLDLGHHTLKAVRLERTAGGLRVAAFASAPTPAECIKDGVVVDPDALGHAIRDMLRSAQIPATVAHIAAAGGAVFIRPVSFPQMAESVLRKTIRFEAAKFVPGSIEDSLVDFEMIGDAGEGQMGVLLVAAPRENVESRVQACQIAGLEVETVDTEVFALHRALLEGDPSPEILERSVALVDIGALTTNVSVLHHGVFAMSRVIPNGGRNLTEALKGYFKLTEEDAEVGKAQLDLSDLLDPNSHSENPPLRVIQPHVDDLIREVRRSLNYFQSQLNEGGGHARIDRLILSGGACKMPGLGDYVRHKLDLEATALGVYDNPRFVRPDAEDAGLDIGVASGLAMRALAKAA